METPAGPQVRLLQCFLCRSVEELPDFEGHPDDDVVLHYADERHGGSTEQPHHRALHRIAAAQWNDLAIKKSVTKQMWEGTTGFTPGYYDVKNTLQEDAAKCFTAHRRQVPCIDWQDSSKILRAPTAAARRALAKELPRGMDIDRERLAKGAPKQYLCSFCAVATHVEHAKRVARGLD